MPGQTRPHAPQLALSVVVSTHCPLHGVNPLTQPAAQAPPAQTWDAPQTWAQVPQLWASTVVSVQAPPQAVWPVGHAHAPPTHNAPAPHAWVQFPQ